MCVQPAGLSIGVSVVLVRTSLINLSIHLVIQCLSLLLCQDCVPAAGGGCFLGFSFPLSFVLKPLLLPGVVKRTELVELFTVTASVGQ